MSKPHILFIMTDQQRVDHVDWHPQSRMSLPNLQRLAEGHVFQNCVTINPICTPARCGLLTGRYSRQVNMLAMSGDLAQSIPTYPQALQRAGYHTIGVGKFHWLQTWKWNGPANCGLDAADISDELHAFGFDEIWEAAGKQLAQRNYCDWSRQLDRKGILADYKAHCAQRGRNFDNAEDTEFTGQPWPFAEEDYVDVATGDQIISKLKNRPVEQPFFGFASFCGPHAPFDPPQRFLDMIDANQDDTFVSGGPTDCAMSSETRSQMHTLRRAYKAMLLCIDEQIGRIFAELERQDMLKDTVIIFTSDHGEMMGDHGFFQKGRPQWQSATVPLAIRHPHHLDQCSHNSMVEITDITASILDLAGIDPQQALSKDWPAFNNIIPCRSLMPLIAGEQDSIRDYAFSECSGRWSMIQTEQYKYIREHSSNDPAAPNELLFHTASDPNECTNLTGDPLHSQALDEGRARLLFTLEKHPPCQTRWAPLTAPDGSQDFPIPDPS